MRLPSFSSVGVWLTAGTLAVGTLHAQAPVRPPTRVRGTITAASAANACAELAATPSALVNGPEGMALLRIKRELESAVFTLEQQRQLQGVEVQRITQVQRGVDSLMRVVVRSSRGDGSDGSVVSLGSDSVRVVVEGRAIEPRRVFVMLDSARVSDPQMEATIRSLQPQITAFIAAAEAQSGRGAGEAGYVGVGLLGAQVRTVTPEGVLVSHCDYPVVETVDVGSPASRAGVRTGDTVLAYNGRDLKQRAVNYQRMLVPGETVRLRVKRGAKARDISVVVAARVVAPSTAPSVVMMSGGSGAVSNSGVAVMLGAQFSTVDDDFADVLGLEPGILVLRAPPGSPFAEAGLRGGEIIRALNGSAVRDVQALRRAIAAAGSREARLTVLSRASGTRTVMLRW